MIKYLQEVGNYKNDLTDEQMKELEGLKKELEKYQKENEEYKIKINNEEEQIKIIYG